MHVMSGCVLSQAHTHTQWLQHFLAIFSVLIMNLELNTRLLCAKLQAIVAEQSEAERGLVIVT